MDCQYITVKTLETFCATVRKKFIFGKIVKVVATKKIYFLWL